MKTALLLLATWCWDLSPDADGYKLYWHDTPSSWCETDFVREKGYWCEGGPDDGQPCDPDDPLKCPIGGVCRACQDDPVLDPPPGGIWYYNAAAFNSVGESEDHGPVEVCP